ncbi:MAG: RpiB/LacA/LacB family sugar-phosphate isomerase [Gemmatimonadaceae bacterium]
MTNPDSMVPVTGDGERIPIASDHAGCVLRGSLVALLTELGYAPDDLGPADASPVDYPDYAHPLARMVSDGEVSRGILLCGTGLGMSYAANRHHGVRAAVAWTPEIARLARQHNDANVLVLPARFVSDAEGREILRAWLDTPFDGGRHAIRVAKIELESERDTLTAMPVATASLMLTTDTESDDGDGRGCGTHEPGTGGT